MLVRANAFVLIVSKESTLRTGCRNFKKSDVANESEKKSLEICRNHVCSRSKKKFSAAIRKGSNNPFNFSLQEKKLKKKFRSTFSYLDSS